MFDHIFGVQPHQGILHLTGHGSPRVPMINPEEQGQARNRQHYSRGSGTTPIRPFRVSGDVLTSPANPIVHSWISLEDLDPEVQTLGRVTDANAAGCPASHATRRSDRHIPRKTGW
jgi:hypothetical protein